MAEQHTPGDEELKHIGGLQYLEDTFMAAVADACGIGYGRMMQLISNKWANLDPIGALTVGPCIGELKPEITTEAPNLSAENTLLKAQKAVLLGALKYIAAGECCGKCGFNEPFCDVMIARAAIAKAEAVETDNTQTKG